MQFAPCPTAKSLEDLYYPDVRDIIDSVCQLVKGEEYDHTNFPPKQSMTDYYKHFKGPF